MNVHPSLELLLTGYFHQDWSLDASSPVQVVGEFAAAEPPEAVTAAIAAIDAILRREDSEVAAEAVLRELSCDVDPRVAFGLSPRAWLQQLRAELDGTLGLGRARPTS